MYVFTVMLPMNTVKYNSSNECHYGSDECHCGSDECHHSSKDYFCINQLYTCTCKMSEVLLRTILQEATVHGFP